MSPSHLHSWFLGVGYSHAYEVFNYFECAAWIVIAAVLHLRFRKHPADQRAVARTCIAPVVIGRSDYFEAPTQARLPWWLWAWKIRCAGPPHSPAPPDARPVSGAAR